MFGQRLFTRHVDDDEEILMVVHKHWLKGMNHMFWPIVGFLAGWGFYVFAPFPIILYMAAMWSMGVFVWGMRNFYDYYLDAWIITDQGIIDVAWHGWFHRESTRVLYSDIQGVSYEIEGVTGTLMRFGTISVEKISTGNVISLDNVKSPRAIEALILKQMEGYLHGKNLSDAKHVQELLSQIVAREISLGQFEHGEEDDEEEYDDDEDEYYDDDEDDEYYEDDDDDEDDDER